MHKHKTGILSQIMNGKSCIPVNSHWDAHLMEEANHDNISKKLMKTGRARREGGDGNCVKVQRKEGNVDWHSGTKEGSRSEQKERKDVGEYTQEENRKGGKRGRQGRQRTQGLED